MKTLAIIIILVIIVVLLRKREHFDRYGLHARKYSEIANVKNTPELARDLKYSNNWREQVYQDINKDNWTSPEAHITLQEDIESEIPEYDENTIHLAQTNKTGMKNSAY